mgnify:CR=1 FL=1
MKNLLLVFFLIAWANLVNAVEPSEVLSDTVLEERARSISQGLRCLQCRNESIDESNAGIAKDLRLLVRERLVAGESDTEVIDYIVVRYGEYVLLKPDMTGANWLLWASGPLTLLFAFGVVVSFSRRRANGRVPTTAALNPQEAETLKKLLDN